MQLGLRLASGERRIQGVSLLIRGMIWSGAAGAEIGVGAINVLVSRGWDWCVGMCVCVCVCMCVCARTCLFALLWGLRVHAKVGYRDGVFGPEIDCCFPLALACGVDVRASFLARTWQG